MRAYLASKLEPKEYFNCWSKFFEATERNYWGGLDSSPVTLYANGVDGGEEWMYIIIVVPEVNGKVNTYTMGSGCEVPF